MSRSNIAMPKVASLGDRQKRIYKFLQSNQTGVLASVDPNGDPHGSVVYYVVSAEDFSVSFITKTGTKKYDNLVHHNRAVLVVFDASTQTVAQVIGAVDEVTELREIFKTARKLSALHRAVDQDEDMPISKLNAGDYAVLKILPVQIRIAQFARPEARGSGELFESIESFDLDLSDASLRQL